MSGRVFNSNSTCRGTGLIAHELTVAFCFLLVVLSAAAQPGTGRIFLDALAFADDTGDSNRVDILLAVPYAIVSFEQQGAVYAGRYVARIRAESERFELLDTSFARPLRTYSYDATVGREADWEFYQLRIRSRPGMLRVFAEVHDTRTNVTTSVNRDLVVPDFGNRAFAISSAMLVTHVVEDSTGYAIAPSFSESFSPGETIFLFFERYNHLTDTTMSASIVVRDPRGDVQLRQTGTVFHVPRGRSQAWMRLATDALPHGQMTATIQFTLPGDSETIITSTTRTFSVGNGDDGTTLVGSALRERVLQLRYVASTREIDRIDEATDDAERQHRFMEFWRQHDPSPATPGNEAMDEYYRRIDHANSAFSSYAPGWLTDKGRIYVIYGPPDNITNDPFHTEGRATETWYFGSRNLRFVFVDQSGFGDFRLMTPVPLGERYHYP